MIRDSPFSISSELRRCRVSRASNSGFSSTLLGSKPGAGLSTPAFAFYGICVAGVSGGCATRIPKKDRGFGAVPPMRPGVPAKNRQRAPLPRFPMGKPPAPESARTAGIGSVTPGSPVAGANSLVPFAHGSAARSGQISAAGTGSAGAECSASRRVSAVAAFPKSLARPRSNPSKRLVVEVVIGVQRRAREWRTRKDRARRDYVPRRDPPRRQTRIRFVHETFCRSDRSASDTFSAGTFSSDRGELVIPPASSSVSAAGPASGAARDVIGGGAGGSTESGTGSAPGSPTAGAGGATAEPPTSFESAGFIGSWGQRAHAAKRPPPGVAGRRVAA